MVARLSLSRSQIANIVGNDPEAIKQLEKTFDGVNNLVVDITTIEGQIATLNARNMIAGAGLTGGGTLAADRTFNVGAGTGVTVGPDTVGLDITNTRNVDHTAVSITAGTGLTGGGDISASRTLNLANTAVTPAAYGSASSVGTFTVDAQGRLIAAASVPISISGSGVTGANLTKTDDTNVTVTLGGTPTGALLNAVSLTFGWSGTLAVSRGGTGGGTASGALLDNISGFASTGQLVRTGGGGYAFRTLSATAGHITVTNGDGVAGNPTLSLPNSGATAASYGSASQVATFTVDAQGRLTAASNTSIAINSGAVSGLGSMATQNAGSVAVTGGSVNGTTVGATTPAAGTFTTAKANNAIQPNAVPSADWGIDYAPSTSAGSYVTIVNNGTYDLAAGSGLLQIYENSGVGAALIMTWFGGTSIIGQSAGNAFTTTLGTAGKINVAFNGTTAYQIENKTGATINVFVSSIRGRTAT